jgi:hypothetical protein
MQKRRNVLQAGTGRTYCLFFRELAITHFPAKYPNEPKPTCDNDHENIEQE